jgi:hypothetical protein
MTGKFFGLIFSVVGCVSGAAEQTPPASTDSASDDTAAPEDTPAAAPNDARVDEPPGPSLRAISGDGSVVIANWPATDPLTVRYVDGKGSGIAGASVAWKVESGYLGMGTPDAMTDADGYARARIRGEFVSPSESFTRQRVSVTVGDQRVEFRVTTMNDNRPSIPIQPQTELREPASRTISGRVGDTIPNAVIVVVAIASGPYIGQPLSDVGLRIVGEQAECVGGTVLTDAKGFVRCDLKLKKPAEESFDVLIGGYAKFTIGASIKP